MQPQRSRFMRKQVSRPIVFSADAAYAFPTLVCMTSIFLNSPHLDFDIYWITTNRQTGASNAAVLAATEELSDAFARRIRVVSVDDSCFDGFTPPSQLPYLGNVTYNWLLAPAVLRIDSFLLLDSDIVVQDNLEFLLSLDVGDNIVAGVSNGTDEWQKENERLNLPGDNEYINTGVMIVNAERWRQERIFDTLVGWYKDHTDKLRLADQDMINVVLGNRKIVLETKWNTQQHTFLDEDIKNFDAEAFRGIFHFTGLVKPWHPEAHPNIQALFWKYARVTRRV
jgi:lipopolysaccharide biosynthesis glycosyltransferase